MTLSMTHITCPSCGLKRKPEEFYATSVECRPCKKERSRENRATTAQKVALADRLLEVLERLVEQGWRPAMSGPSGEPRELQP